MDSIAYVNGSFVPLSEAKVSILDRGFLFADGIYEVSAVLDGKLVDNASHLARLERSVGEISLKLPESIDRIVEIQKELIARNKLESGLVYHLPAGCVDEERALLHQGQPSRVDHLPGLRGEGDVEGDEVRRCEERVEVNHPATHGRKCLLRDLDDIVGDE